MFQIIRDCGLKMNLLSHLIIIKILMKKNWLTRLHHKISFLLIFFIPICLAGITVVLSITTNYTYKPGRRSGKVSLNGSHYTPKSLHKDNGIDTTLIYNSYTNKILEIAENNWMVRNLGQLYLDTMLKLYQCFWMHLSLIIIKEIKV